MTVESTTAALGIGCVWFQAIPHTVTDRGAYITFSDVNRAFFPAETLVKKSA